MIATYYEKFGVGEHASLEEITATFSRLDAIYNPLWNYGDDECRLVFEEITDIYEILSDSISRREYDVSLKLKRENLKKIAVAHEAFYLTKEKNHIRNYYKRYTSTASGYENGTRPGFAKRMYRQIGPFGLVFVVYMLCGIVSRAFDKPVYVQEKKPIRFDSLVYTKSENEAYFISKSGQ